jgi:hypothetical protein
MRREEQDQCTERIRQLKDVDRDYVDFGVRVLELAQKAHTLYVNETADEKRQLLVSLLSKCTLNAGTLCVTYRKPFDLILETNQTKEMLPRLDSNQRPAD